VVHLLPYLFPHRAPALLSSRPIGSAPPNPSPASSLPVAPCRGSRTTTPLFSPTRSTRRLISLPVAPRRSLPTPPWPLSLPGPAPTAPTDASPPLPHHVRAEIKAASGPDRGQEAGGVRSDGRLRAWKLCRAGHRRGGSPLRSLAFFSRSIFASPFFFPIGIWLC
jgi:hypothetical protein